MKNLLIPNERINTQERTGVAVAWIVGVLVGWEAFRSPIFPSLIDIIKAFPTLWLRDGLGHALMTSMLTNLEALAISTALSLPIAYLSRVPMFEPVSVFISKLRFLSISVFFLIFLFMFGGGHVVKVSMLVAGETFFLTTTMVGIVQSIPLANFDDVRTLRMGEWQGLFYVVVRGTLHQALDAIRDNAAIGWTMLMMVEGFVRSEGGVGVLLLNQEKYLRFDMIYAIAISVVLAGLLQDFILTQLKRSTCPYSL